MNKQNTAHKAKAMHEQREHYLCVEDDPTYHPSFIDRMLFSILRGVINLIEGLIVTGIFLAFYKLASLAF